jgi:pseudouridine kinase
MILSIVVCTKAVWQQIFEKIDFDMADVVVIGGANIDIKAKSISRNILGTSNPGEVTISPGGVGRNIAHNLARLGVDVALISMFGDDLHGDLLLEHTKAAGVDVSAVERQPVATGTYVAVLDDDGELVTAMSDMRAVESLTPEFIAKHFDKLHAARLVVADCNLPLATLQAIAAFISHKLVIETVSVPKCEKLLQVAAKSPILLTMPNFDQVEKLTGTRDIHTAFAKLHGRGIANIVIHAGAEGAFVSDGESIEHVPSRTTGAIVDVTGAGDAAVAGLIFGLLQGENLDVAAGRGQEQAARVIGTSRSTLD